MGIPIRGGSGSGPVVNPPGDSTDDLTPTPRAPVTARADGWDGKSDFASTTNPGSVVAGAVTARSGIRVPVQAQTRYQTQRFTDEITGARDAVNAQIDSLRARRDGLTTQLRDVSKQISDLQARKPNSVAAGDPWLAQMSDLTRQRTSIDSTRTSITRDITRLQNTPLNVEGARVTPGKLGPVSAVVTDNATGQTFRGINHDTPPANLTNVVRERLANLDLNATHPSTPGTHAEYYALNEAVAAREARTGRPVTASELGSFTLDTAWLRGDANKGQGMAAGAPAERCANCQQGTAGIDNLAGDSTRAFEGPNPARPPAGRWSGRNMDAARGGAQSGAAAGLLFGAIDEIRSGHFDAGHLAATTAMGAGTGALGGLIDETAGRAIDRVAGGALQRGATAVAQRFATQEVAQGAASTVRALGSRLGGAGAAGAIINAGFSAVDQIGAYRRGEVTASQAIGTVTGEAAVGAGAGLAGAAAGAAIGSIIPVAGTAVGAVIGFAVGVGAGYLADKGLRGLGVNTAIAHGVTATIDAASSAISSAGHALSNAGSAISSGVSSLAHVFGW